MVQEYNDRQIQEPTRAQELIDFFFDTKNQIKTKT